MLTGWLRRLSGKTPSESTSPERPRCRPKLEPLEERAVPTMTVTPNVNGTQLAQALIGTNGVAISNVSFFGQTQAKSESAGTFTSSTNGTQDVGFAKGIVLSTGAAKGVIGPNNSGSSTTGTAWNGPGNKPDPDLDAIVKNTTDTTILEFDFVPNGNTLTFNYVFGSDEYNEYVNAGYNDVFAFFLNKQNIALIPNTTTPVTIDNVNNGKNSQYYIDNTKSPNPRPDIQMDGLTVVLQVSAAVTKGQTTHIKLAIADVGDHSYDSNVMIEAGSFTAAPPTVNPPPPPPPAKAEPVLFRPYRMIYRPATHLYYGIFNLINVGGKNAVGTFQLEFTKLPFGVSVAYPNGIDQNTHHPFVNVPSSVLPAHRTVRIGINLRNPYHMPMTTFFLSNTMKAEILNTSANG